MREIFSHWRLEPVYEYNYSAWRQLSQKCFASFLTRSLLYKEPFRVDSFFGRVLLKRCKHEVTKVVSLAKFAENLPNVASPLKSPIQVCCGILIGIIISVNRLILMKRRKIRWKKKKKKKKKKKSWIPGLESFSQLGQDQFTGTCNKV